MNDMKLIFFSFFFGPQLQAKRPCSGVTADVTLSRGDLIPCPVSDGELLLTPGA